MTELLFKLKKAGRGVRYARFQGSGLLYSWSNDDHWEYAHRFSFDSIHPFVCKDRAGKDVFEGDVVLCEDAKYTVSYREKAFDWVLLSAPIGDVGPYAIAICPSRIELIEDQP